MNRGRGRKVRTMNKQERTRQQVLQERATLRGRLAELDRELQRKEGKQDNRQALTEKYKS